MPIEEIQNGERGASIRAKLNALIAAVNNAERALTEYSALNGKPSIGNVVLVGNKTLQELGVDTLVRQMLEEFRLDLYTAEEVRTLMTETFNRLALVATGEMPSEPPVVSEPPIPTTIDDVLMTIDTPESIRRPQNVGRIFNVANEFTVTEDYVDYFVDSITPGTTFPAGTNLTVVPVEETVDDETRTVYKLDIFIGAAPSTAGNNEARLLELLAGYLSKNEADYELLDATDDNTEGYLLLLGHNSDSSPAAWKISLLDLVNAIASAMGSSTGGEGTGEGEGDTTTDPLSDYMKKSLTEYAETTEINDLSNAYIVIWQTDGDGNETMQRISLQNLMSALSQNTGEGTGDEGTGDEGTGGDDTTTGGTRQAIRLENPNPDDPHLFNSPMPFQQDTVTLWLNGLRIFNFSIMSEYEVRLDDTVNVGAEDELYMEAIFN